MSFMEHTFVVVTTKPHIADTFAEGVAAGARPHVVMYRDFGLDAPVVTQRCSWRVASGHATRLAMTGVNLNLSAPGPHWLTRVDVELLGRRVWAGQVKDLGSAPTSGFAKPAEAKVPALPATWYDDTSDFRAAAQRLLVPNARVQVADVLLDIESEYRCFVRDQRVVTSCAYLLHNCGERRQRDGTWGTDPRIDEEGAHLFARDAVAAFGTDQPYAYNLDVARLRSGRFVVLEANPAWAAGVYICDPVAATETVIASSDSGRDHGQFRWAPDPYLVWLAAQHPKLTRWVPDWEPAAVPPSV